MILKGEIHYLFIDENVSPVARESPASKLKSEGGGRKA